MCGNAKPNNTAHVLSFAPKQEVPNQTNNLKNYTILKDMPY